MAQGYYSLEEAAQVLSMSEEELTMLARKGDIRSFQDRGTWRFREADIQELARQRGLGSEPDLVIGDAAAPPDEQQPEVFDFSMDAEDEAEFADIGNEGAENALMDDAGNIVEPDTPYPGSDSDVRLVSESAEQDFGIEIESDVRLDDGPRSSSRLRKSTSDSSKKKMAPSDITAPDSAVGLAPHDRGAGSISGLKKPLSDSSKKKLPPADTTAPDSGVRLVPMDSDSDVRIVGSDSGDVQLGETSPMSASDSDIRMQFDADGPPDSPPGALTEEIDLDAEQQKWEEQQAAQAAQQAEFPETSPFDLADSDFDLPSTGSTAHQPMADSGSSDFDLTPEAESSSPLDLGSSDFELGFDESGSEEVDLGAKPSPTQLAGPSSGISIDNPVDSGISLEQESEGSDEFDLSLDADMPSGPVKTSLAEDGSSNKGADSSGDFDLSSSTSALDADSSNEFELSLDDSDSSSESVMGEDSSSEFELTLEDEPSSDESFLDSESGSSEFELTLDADDSDSSSEVDSDSEFNLSLDADESSAPDLDSDSEFELQLNGDTDSDSEFDLTIDDDDVGFADDESDIGTLQLEESDDEILEIPELEDDSGSQVEALDTDLESSDFDMDLDDAESTSQVVTLDEDDVDDFSDDLVDVGDRPGFDTDSGFDDLEPDVFVEEDEEEEDLEPVVVDKQAAPWGALPVVVLLPCAVVLLLVAIMCFEQIQGLNGYEEGGFFTKFLTSLTKSGS